MVAVCALTMGVGLTGTVNKKLAPTQLLELGVTVYTAVLAILLVLLNICEMLDCPVNALPPVKPDAGVNTGVNQE